MLQLEGIERDIDRHERTLMLGFIPDVL